MACHVSNTYFLFLLLFLTAKGQRLREARDVISLKKYWPMADLRLLIYTVWWVCLIP